MAARVVWVEHVGAEHGYCSGCWRVLAAVLTDPRGWWIDYYPARGRWAGKPASSEPGGREVRGDRGRQTARLRTGRAARARWGTRPDTSPKDLIEWAEATR